MDTPLSPEERQLLLQIARQAIEHATRGQHPPQLELTSLPPRLQAPGASFVTLNRPDGSLRGCIGALEAYQPLALDVQEHAIAAALQDPRFPPVRPEEVPSLQIEVSRLTPPVRLEYRTPAELPALLRPGVDGVILQDGWRKATFLPQVWEQLPEPESFLSHLCAKMGASPDLWRRKTLDVFTYQVEAFHER